jgi:hypothetical protein
MLDTGEVAEVPERGAWLTEIRPTPRFFRMCGKQRTCRRAILDVWQGKELREDFSDVWQGKELGRESGEWRVTGDKKREENPAPRGIWMDVKRKELQEKGSVRL